ncbi:MAG TPA: cache domain-containing protein [Bacillota bacterium]|nr:cache domain-containing protein [Bacillota bacterium]
MIYYFAAQIVEVTVKDSLKEIAKQGASHIHDNLDSSLDLLDTLTSLDSIKAPDKPWDEKFRVIEAVSKQKSLNLLRISIAGTDGFARTSDGLKLFIGDRLYYQKGLTGHRYISNPIISRFSNSMVIVFVSPIYYQGKVSGVLYATYSIEALSRITDDIRIGKNGYSFIINEKGETIAHRNRELVFKRDNDFTNIKSHPQLKALVALEKQMINRETSAGEYLYHGVRKYMGFAPIEGTGWSFAITIPRSQIFQRLDRMLLIFCLLFMVVLLLYVLLNASNLILQNSLEREKTFLDNAIETASIIVLEAYGNDGLLKGVNRYAEEKMGYSLSELKKKTLFEFIPKSHLDQVQALLQQKVSKQAWSRLEFPLVNKDGEEIPFIWNAQITRTALGIPVLTLMGVDITKRVQYERKLLESNQKLTALYQNLSSSKELLRQQYANYRQPRSN